MYHRFLFYQNSIYTANHFEHTHPLPDYFWNPSEISHDMNCLTTVITAVDTHAYSHHIERLMIIGNISLLTQTNPQSLLIRFWEQYLDAFEWVVTPNVLGMSQFADG